jgi:hypothetical protein
VQEPGGCVVLVVLLVVVDVLVELDDDDDVDVLDVVGPLQPQVMPLIAAQSSAGRGQSRLGSPQPGGDSCEQSDASGTQAHVPFGRSHRQTSPAAHAPPHVPPDPSAWNEHGPEGTVVVVVLLVLVVLVLLEVVVDDDVLDVVGPLHPQIPPPIDPH